MQKPIRYYITKNGEEPTVRSVTVAQPATRPDDRPAVSPTTAVEKAELHQETTKPAAGVKRRVKDAIRKRSSRS